MTINSGIFTITTGDPEGHDNLGHSISETTIGPEKLNSTTEQSNTIMPPKPQIRLGFKTGIVLDVFIFISTVLWTALAELGVVPAYKQGFYCETDNKIVYKYTGDTISAAVIGISVLFPVIIMYAVEVLRSESTMPKAIKNKKIIIRTFLWSRDYIIGLAVKLFIVETLKVVLGELRPHFLDTCRPDAAINCTRGEYITEYTCTNTDDGFYIMSDSSRSFPSGHSSLGMYEATFAAWYLQRRFPKSNTIFLLPFIQCLCLTWGFVCGATRVIDNRHHWWDVLAGDIIGVIFACVSCAVLCNNFRVKSALPDHINQNGHTSVRRLLSDGSCKDESNIAMATA